MLTKRRHCKNCQKVAQIIDVETSKRIETSKVKSDINKKTFVAVELMKKMLPTRETLT